MASSLSLHVDAEKLRVLNSKITKCALCPRLAKYVRQIGRNKVRRFVDEAYWARPVPGFGEIDCLILGAIDRQRRIPDEQRGVVAGEHGFQVRRL